LLDDQGRPAPDIYDPDLWQSNGWGLADPDQNKVVKMLLPDIASPEKRREIALDHQRKALLRAKQFTAALKEIGPGDGTVLRSSALMDERVVSDLKTRLVSPIQWAQVLFVFSDHLGITKDPAFTDNLLYFLLESPRKD
jgi:hypothetical protein